MNTLSTHRTLHPMLWVAAIAVTVLSLVGIAAMTGLMPISRSAESPAIPQPVASTATPSSEPVATPPAPPVATPAPPPQVVVKRVEPAPHRHREQIARADVDAMPMPPPPPPVICNDCGNIESVQRVVHEGSGSGVGAVAGGVLGGALGNGVGQGNGRSIATIAGVIGGAMLGNHVEKSQKQTVSWKTTVRFDDGSSRIFDSPVEQGFREGERVKLINGAIQPAQ